LKFSKALSTSNSVSIYGSGTFAQLVIQICLKIRVKIDGVYDHVNIGKVLNTSNGDFLVNDFRDINNKIGVNNLILGVCNLRGDIKNIAQSIKKISPDINIFSPVEFCNFLESIGEKAIQNYWLHENLNFYNSNITAINSFREMLEDEESVAVYDSILKYRISGRIEDVPLPRNLQEQYLPNDLATPPYDLLMVDLGACQGENIEYFLNSGRRFQLCFMLEPDKSNLEILVAKLKKFDIRNNFILQLAAYSSSKILKFDFLANGSSVISEHSNEIAFGIALDDLLKNTSINYIKMDIEGSELDALKGSENIIKRDLPHLAISIYHKPSDLWEIGLYLFSIYGNKYKYHIRNYGHQTFDTVLYAIPTL
jgi:FkbM family methyltransferase